MAKQGGQTPLYEQVVKMVKDQIVSGVYTKGDLLPSEKEMIDNFGVSRITVRKALSILSDMGYIRTEKGRGSEVILDVEDLLSRGKFSEEMTAYRRLCMEATQVRILLEPEIARQVAIKATDEQLASLRIWENHIRMKNPTNEFHLALAEILGNQELVRNVATVDRGGGVKSAQRYGVARTTGKGCTDIKFTTSEDFESNRGERC